MKDIDGAEYLMGLISVLTFGQDGPPGGQVVTCTTVTLGSKCNWHLLFNLKELEFLCYPTLKLLDKVQYDKEL